MNGQYFLLFDIFHSTSSTLTINNVTVADSGVYTCVIYSTGGVCTVATSNGATVNVNQLPITNNVEYRLQHWVTCEFPLGPVIEIVFHCPNEEVSKKPRIESCVYVRK